MTKFENLVKSNKRIYLSKDFEIKQELKLKKKQVKAENSDLKPCINDEYKCLTCGIIGQSHPLTGYCFVCDTDNWGHY